MRSDYTNNKCTDGNGEEQSVGETPGHVGWGFPPPLFIHKNTKKVRVANLKDNHKAPDISPPPFIFYFPKYFSSGNSLIAHTNSSLGVYFVIFLPGIMNRYKMFYFATSPISQHL